jgi:hypothetical protein
LLVSAVVVLCAAALAAVGLKRGGVPPQAASSE